MADVANLRDSAMRLRLTAERLAAAVESATQERRDALRRYPRVRRFAARLLHLAAARQQAATFLSIEVSKLEPQLKLLQQQAEVLEFFQAEGAEGIKADLREVEQIIKAWSTVPEAGEPAPRVDGERDGGAPGSPSVSMRQKR